MQQNRINFIVTETTALHDKVAEAYEALMDGENKEAVKILDSIAEKARELKTDLSTKED
jgi:hypothetical protein